MISKNSNILAEFTECFLFQSTRETSLKTQQNFEMVSGKNEKNFLKMFGNFIV